MCFCRSFLMLVSFENACIEHNSEDYIDSKGPDPSLRKGRDLTLDLGPKLHAKGQMLHIPKARVTYTSTGRILSIFMVPTASNRRKKKKIGPRKTRIIWVFVILTCNIVTLRLWMRLYGMRGRVECATHWCRHSVHDQPESKKLKCKLHFFSTVEHFTSCHLPNTAE